LGNAKLRAFTGFGGAGLNSYSDLEVFLPVLITVGIACVTDLRSRRVPNWLVSISLLAGLIEQMCRHGWPGVLNGLAAVLVALLLFGSMFLLGGMGAGDVKLMAAAGCWMGLQQTLAALVLTSLVGGVMALTWAVAGGFLQKLLKDTAGLILRRGEEDRTLANPARRRMPYAPAVAIGCLLSFLSQTGLLAHLTK